MAQCYFFIGPCGSGKTTICSRLHQKVINKKTLIHFELDNLLKSGSQAGIDKIIELEANMDSYIYLVDVGAFFQYYSEEEFWIKRKKNLICLHNNPEVCYEIFRNRPKPRPHNSIEEFKKAEFCEKREKLYKSAELHIETNQTEESTQSIVENYITKNRTY